MYINFEKYVIHQLNYMSNLFILIYSSKGAPLLKWGHKL
jgi:hypothetical protein